MCSNSCRVHSLGFGDTYDRNFTENLSFYGLGCHRETNKIEKL